MFLKDVNETLDHKIVGGSEYCWTCWDNARFLDYESDFSHASVVFNSQTQEIYCAEITSKEDDLVAYRWLNPAFKQAHLEEAKSRGVDPNIAWDDVTWVDLELAEDFLEKAQSIFNGAKFDRRVSIPLTFTDEELLKYMKLAHERDITFNQLIEEALLNAIEECKNGKLFNTQTK